MKRLFTYFLQGLLLLAPLAVTLYSVFLFFDFVDRLVRDPLEAYFKTNLPGIGVLFLFVFLTFLGLIGETMIAKPFINLTSKILNRAPLIKVVYSSIKDLFSAFVGKEKKFNKAVVVCVNKADNIWRVGFITQKDLTDIGLAGMVAVYFPFSYALTGELLLVPAESVKPLDLPSSEAMKFVVSGGVTRVN